MVKTEGQHTGEFLVSEGNGSISREVRNIASGTTLVDGQLLQLSGDNLVPLTAGGTVVGIAYGGGTATVQRPKRLPYIARLAEVKYELLTFPADSDQAAIVGALKQLGIIVRNLPDELPEPPTEDPSEEPSEAPSEETTEAPSEETTE
jgi:hypothetical protein